MNSGFFAATREVHLRHPPRIIDNFLTVYDRRYQNVFRIGAIFLRYVRSDYAISIRPQRLWLPSYRSL